MKRLLVVCGLLIFTSCDPVTHVEFYVKNANKTYPADVHLIRNNKDTSLLIWPKSTSMINEEVAFTSCARCIVESFNQTPGFYIVIHDDTLRPQAHEWALSGHFSNKKALLTIQ